jgi:hypothetical protein
MTPNNKKTIEESVLALLDQGKTVDEIKKQFDADPEISRLLSILDKFDQVKNSLPDSRWAFTSWLEKLNVTPGQTNRYIIESREGRVSLLNKLTPFIMKTKIVIGATLAGIVVIAAAGYLFIAKRGALPVNIPSVSSLISQESTWLKTSEVSLENPEALVNAINSMADAELIQEDELYSDIDLVSLDDSSINDIYNAYDQTQL